MSTPSSTASRNPRGSTVRTTRQQQPGRLWLNRQQQQQGYSEYQQGQAAPAGNGRSLMPGEAAARLSKSGGSTGA